MAVCSPDLITQHFPEAMMSNNNRFDLTPQQLIELPLLQQTTRPHIWDEWFNLHAITHPHSARGQRHELFSMLAVAANHGMGMALIPKMLIEKELKSKDLVIISTKKLEKGELIILYIPPKKTRY